MLASQCRRNGRDVSITASQLGKTSIGGAASSASRARTASSMEGGKLNVAPFFSKGRNWAHAFGLVGQELAVIAETS